MACTNKMCTCVRHHVAPLYHRRPLHRLDCRRRGSTSLVVDTELIIIGDHLSSAAAERRHLSSSMSDCSSCQTALHSIQDGDMTDGDAAEVAEGTVPHAICSELKRTAPGRACALDVAACVHAHACTCKCTLLASK